VDVTATSLYDAAQRLSADFDGMMDGSWVRRDQVASSK
jgi:hypothetical protein